MTPSEFQHIAPGLPIQPGIYKYFGKKNELLYIGKAKNIRKRVSSYFIKKQASYKTYELVNQIHHIEFTIVNSEQDAFFLENSLIKKFQPRYNINLKDDKTYPHIIIKKENFPRVFLTRKLIHDGSEYLGPYTSVQKVRELLSFIKQTIPLRNCTLNLTEKNIERKKFKVCLEYHLGNCKGPCEGLQTRDDYEEGLQQVRNLLRGNLNPVIQHFKEEMKQLARDMKFEKAEMIKAKIDFLKNYQARSVISNSRLQDLDIFFIVKSGDKAFINYLMVQNGSVVQTQTLPADIFLDEPEEEILIQAIARLRERFKSHAKEIVIPFPLNYPEEGITLTVPRGGDKKKLLELSEKNAKYFLEEVLHKKRLNITGTGPDKPETLTEMKEALHLPSMPEHIECFDNSNFQGSYPVSAMVCFKHGEPSKKDYRLFNVKTVEGINDFATMKEAVYRRYKRVLEENLPWPQLVIIDGGKGQLHAAQSALEDLNASGKTTLIGLAKNEEEIFFPGDHESLKLPFQSNSLKLIRRIRDEVHRFGINFHRKKRSEGAFKTGLEEIPGIGKATCDLLLKEYRTVKNLKGKTEDEIALLIGQKKAKLLTTWLKK
jgi:excinuclease ABC subunit C